MGYRNNKAKSLLASNNLTMLITVSIYHQLNLKPLHAEKKKLTLTQQFNNKKL
jgi:hypothetical protein